ncbi:microtubule-associated protein tau-like isoform X3 [Gigantopelta aegis]|uniref:microtubule-associated protein tau-like isoform X3 n=1 Tax=Gigantopelta aegis TaxID=1735272 RepID=UPI001B88D8EC|nr:microtubule-associated protein tau-like isoform X3 [Gigantopelta aegis]
MSHGHVDTLQGISQKEMSAPLNGDVSMETEMRQVNGMPVDGFTDGRRSDPMQESFHQDIPSTNPFADPQLDNAATIPQGMLIDLAHPSQAGSTGVPASPPPVSSLLQPQVENLGELPSSPQVICETDLQRQQAAGTFQQSGLEFCQSPALQTDLDTLGGEKPNNCDPQMTTDDAVTGGHGDEPSRATELGYLGSCVKPGVEQTHVTTGSSHRDEEDNRERSANTLHDGQGLGSAVLGDTVMEGSSEMGERAATNSQVLHGESEAYRITNEQEMAHSSVDSYSGQDNLVSVQKGMESCVLQENRSVAESPTVNGHDEEYHSKDDRTSLPDSNNTGSNAAGNHLHSIVEDTQSTGDEANNTVSSETVQRSEVKDVVTDRHRMQAEKKPGNGSLSPKKSGLPTRSMKTSAPPPSVSSKGWDSTVVIPPKPRPLSALITPKNVPEEPPLRPRPSSAKSSSESKKYGISTKQQGYKPGGGDVKIFNEKKDYAAQPRIDAKMSHTKAPKPASPRTPAVTSPPPKTSSAKSKIGSMDKITHKPGGGDVAIVNKKPDVSNVTSKIGSKDKITHKPGGGNVKIETKKIVVDKVTSKVGSLNNTRHKPGGGDKKIETKKLDWKVESKVGSLDNAKHNPGGGGKKIETKKVEWTAESKVGSMDKVHHTPGGGDKKIETKKLEWKTEPKVGSLDKVHHTPGGGNKKIESQKLTFKESAKAKTDHGASPSSHQQSRSSTSSASEVSAEQ